MLSIKQQIHGWQLLDNWFYSAQGLWLGNAFMEVLEPSLSGIRGNILLQIGQCGTNSWLNQLDFQYKYIVSPYKSRQMDHVIASIIRLPFERNSVDCVCVPLGMELFKKSNVLLDEIDRILIPSGQVIIVGINPFSMWGLAAKTGLLSGISSRILHLRSSFSINRACIARGYEQTRLTNFGYIPPVQSKKNIDRFFFMDEIGKMLWPFPAGFYCYIAQKQVPGFVRPMPVPVENMDWQALVT